MRALFISLFLLFLQCNLAIAQNTVTTFILIRHGEKVLDDSDDPALLPEGEARAERLVSLLGQTKIDGIYSTRYKRTMSTVTPLAKSKGLDVKVYEPLKEAPIDDIIKKHAGGTVVVCGHSNTTPWVANLLIGKKELEDFNDNDYGNILIVDVVSKGKVAKITRLRY